MSLSSCRQMTSKVSSYSISLLSVYCYNSQGDPSTTLMYSCPWPRGWLSSAWRLSKGRTWGCIWRPDWPTLAGGLSTSVRTRWRVWRVIVTRSWVRTINSSLWYQQGLYGFNIDQWSMSSIFYLVEPGPVYPLIRKEIWRPRLRLFAAMLTPLKGLVEEESDAWWQEYLRTESDLEFL